MEWEHRIKREIIPAVEIGKRMQLVTIMKPEAVRDEHMTDTEICRLHLDGIREIHMVAGHLKERF